ncbi:MAG: flagellar basal body rod protein FlgC [Candidatus Dadabacteria bacterium]|nr:MAG: flagellar basal body rod protein FlgC [Candidatus Dadabacteria bacterium]
MFDTMEVLASGLSVARLRVNTIASNFANAQTTRTEDGGPYKRRDVVQIARPVKSHFASVLDRMTLAKPTVAAVVEDQSPPRLVYDPGHPDANKDGYVAYPNINTVQSMTDLMSATRLYQANLSAMNAVKRMMRDATQIAMRF